MLDWLQNLTTFQWVMIGGAAILLGWPALKKALVGTSGLLPKWPSSGASSCIDLVVDLRKHLADDPEAIKALDEVVMPAAIRHAVKDHVSE